MRVFLSYLVITINLEHLGCFRFNFLARTEVAPVVSVLCWLAGSEGIEKKMDSPIMGYIGATIRIHPFIPSEAKGRQCLTGMPLYRESIG